MVGTHATQDQILLMNNQMEITWIDLPSTNRLTLDAVRERYGLPPEAMTYFLLRYESVKVIHAGSALFLVTFLTLPSPRSLFTLRELKLCVTSTRVVTWCGSSGRAQPELVRLLPGLPSLGAQGVGSCLCGLLAGVVASYEAIVNLVEEQRLNNEPREERQRWSNRIEKFLRFLRDERVFLARVTREGRKTEENQQLLHLEERVGTLARRVWSAARHQGDKTMSLANMRASNGGRDT
jgi:Mg2+ and Co2+ transporter CorA